MQFSIIQVVVIVPIFSVFVYLLWYVPKRQVKALGNLAPEARLKIENDTRKIMAEILGGACILIGLVFTWETIRGTAENLRISQEGLQVSQDSVRIAREGQTTEQFIRAIEQLGRVDEVGKDHLAIRLGGIRGLERLSGTSAKDYWPIMEILTTYIREQTRWRADKKREDVEQDGLKPEIQAILGVLGNRSGSYGKEEKRALNLRGVDLRGAILEMFNLDGADFTLAHLEKAKLKGIKLSSAVLKGAYLNGADLEQAQLVGADLSATNLSGANLTNAVFRDARLGAADFSGATLDNADLLGVNLGTVRNLTREQIRKAKTDQTTQLPNGL